MAPQESDLDSNDTGWRFVAGGVALAVGLGAGYLSIGPRVAAMMEKPPSPAGSSASLVPFTDAGNVELPDAPSPAEDAMAKVTDPVERAGFVDRSGHLAIAAVFAQARAFKDGLAAVAVGERWGFVNAKGEIAIPPSFGEADDFSEGLALVRNEEKKAGYVDRQGKLVLDFQFDVAWPFKTGVAIVGEGPTDERKYRLIHKNGETVARLAWEPLGNFSEGFATLRVSDNQIGYFDKTGHVTVRVRLDSVQDFSDGMVVAVLHGKYCAMNREWRVVIGPTFDKMGDFAEGLADAVTDSHHGFIDKKGHFVIAPTYDDASRFSEGLAAVARDGRWGFVDHAGREVIEPKFEQASSFSHGLAAVRVGGKFGYIDPKGNWIIQPEFGKAGDFGKEGLSPVFLADAEKSPNPSGSEGSPPPAGRDD